MRVFYCQLGVGEKQIPLHWVAALLHMLSASKYSVW